MIETMPTSEIMPILPLSLDLDFVDDLVEQWPYIFAQIIAERETQAQNSTLKLVTILETVKKNNGPGQPLKRFACPKFDDKWLMTEGDWLRWKEAFNSVQ